MGLPFDSDSYHSYDKKTTYYLQAQLPTAFTFPTYDSQLYTIDTWEIINETTEETNLINGIWTAPTDGFYRITLKASFDITANNDMWIPVITVNKNTTETIATRVIVGGAAIFPIVSQYENFNINIIEELNQNDTIKIEASVFGTTGTNLRLLNKKQTTLNFERIN